MMPPLLVRGCDWKIAGRSSRPAVMAVPLQRLCHRGLSQRNKIPAESSVNKEKHKLEQAFMALTQMRNI
jgi:hypothetical protein